MKESWSEKQTQFWKDGYVIFENLFPKPVLERWVEFVKFYSEDKECIGVNHIHKKFDKPDLETRDGIGEYKFTSIDGRFCFNFTGLTEYYHSLSNFLSLFTGLDLVESWDKQSAVTFMNYTAPGGQIIPHYDTNGFTLLLYLTDNPTEGATSLQPISSLKPTVLGHPDEVISPPILIYPKIGKVVFFQGRKCWHQSLPVTEHNKVSVVMNYYERDDNWRPADVSKRLYS